MYLPSSAVSILLECLPTFSSKDLVNDRLARAIWRVVDRIPGSWACCITFYWVASLALSLAIFRSSCSALVGIYTTEIVFPASRAVFIASYASQTYCCPDCWRGSFSVNTAALLLVASMILRSLTSAQYTSVVTARRAQPWSHTARSLRRWRCGPARKGQRCGDAPRRWRCGEMG